MKSILVSLFLFLLAIGSASAAVDGSIGAVGNEAVDDGENGRILGYNLMNAKTTSRKYWRGVYNDCCKGSKKRIRKNCDCPVRFVGRWKKKWNRSCKTTIKDRAGK
jgi:hypothetical protein